MQSKAQSAMTVFGQLTRRHLLVFFKNKIRLFYTLLVPVIIFAVYVFFLRGLELSTVENTLYRMGITPDEHLTRSIGTLVDSWMLAGIAALSSITVSLQTNTVFVEDKQNGVNRDFASSPIRRSALIGSYIVFNFFVTLLVCVVYLAICFVYLAAMGEYILDAADFFTVLGVTLYTTISSTLMTVLLCSFIKTEGTMASLVAVFSTAVGFLIGAYMPLGILPDWVQTVCAFIPGTYACALLRYSFMATPIAELERYVVEVLALSNGAELIAEVTSSFGYDLVFFSHTVQPPYQMLALTVFNAIFLVLNIFSGKKLADVLGVGKKVKKKRAAAAAQKDAPAPHADAHEERRE